MERQRVDFETEVLIKHLGFAVDVYHSCLGANDSDLGHLKNIDFGRFVDVAAQEKAAHDGKLNGIGLANDA